MNTMKHGCHNKPDHKPAYPVQDGWSKDGQRIMKMTPDHMSKPCQYDLRPTDPACDGCRWRHEGE